jgi:glycosyltransferase involved in cell wall biosynthesis
MKTLYYWSPSLTSVATNKAVINSAISVKKYLKNFEPIIIDVCGEFFKYENELKNNNIRIIKLYLFNYHKILPKNGFVKSRFSFLIIILLSFFPLLLLIKNKKPDFLIIHLITSLPLLISSIFSFNTKIILRISGLPTLNLFRKLIWQLSKKIFAITCPTEGTYINIINKKIFPKQNIFLLKDPVIDIGHINKAKLSDENLPKNYLLAIGRLTRQKNFTFLIDAISEFLHHNRYYKLLIIGEGEEKNILFKMIEKYKLENSVFLLGYKKNIFNYLHKAKLFILSSLWEDPGFVILEAAATNTLILSSDCPNGPSEILENGGYLFKSNNKSDFLNKLQEALYDKKETIFLKKVVSKKNARMFTKFFHSQKLHKILTK